MSWIPLCDRFQSHRPKQQPVPRIISVDLAYKHYRDVGVALLEATPRGIAVTLLDIPLSGAPTPDALCEWLVLSAAEYAVSGLCIDGPLGWKAPHTESLHSRMSEKSVRAPGKTGFPPDGVKPRGYLAFTQFSIALFERLTMREGFTLPGDESPTDGLFVTETFPTAAWRALGLTALPGKAATKPHDMEAARERLALATGIELPSHITHDQLQAVVGGIAGVRWAGGEHAAVQLAGLPPFRLDGCWREGYIMVPASA
jgi:hypothetical protein